MRGGGAGRYKIIVCVISASESQKSSGVTRYYFSSTGKLYYIP